MSDSDSVRGRTTVKTVLAVTIRAAQFDHGYLRSDVLLHFLLSVTKMSPHVFNWHAKVKEIYPQNRRRSHTTKMLLFVADTLCSVSIRRDITNARETLACSLTSGKMSVIAHNNSKMTGSAVKQFESEHLRLHCRDHLVAEWCDMGR